METQVARSQTASAPRARAPRIPLVDILESEQDVLVLADVPGSTPESIQLEVEQGVLRFRAEGAGSTWARTFLVPRGIAVDRISAALVAGVLRITLPKADEARRRTVEVKAG